MNRRTLSIALFLAVSLWTTSCTRRHVFIVATSGTPQSAAIDTAFGEPLVATVQTGSGRPLKGVKVTFTILPKSGASATFSGGSNTATATTDANGNATSPVLTANGTPGGPYTALATISLTREPALFVLTNTGGTAAGIACTSGTPQSTQVLTPFAQPLGVQVVDGGGNATSDPGVVVTFTPPGAGASATFAGGVNTATTNASGLATSVQVSANGTVGGPYNVVASATVADSTQTCNFSLTNSAIPITTENFVFYATGQESTINPAAAPLFYSIAGVVTIETNGPNPGEVLGGEQDFNDAFGVTATDTFTGGMLTVDPTTGEGTLTLQTNDDSFGDFATPLGEEEFAVQFINANHALVTQWDVTATSSGSLDLQTATGTPSGNFAFNLSGVDPLYCPLVAGGVVSISGATFSGTYDVEDPCVGETGTAVTGTAFPGGITVTAPDTLGRGTFTDTGIATTIAYYVVGPEVARIIDIDSDESAVGSAFGQGAGAFSNSSLGTFVFEDLGNPWNLNPAPTEAEGMLTANSGAGTVQGVGDVNESGFVSSAATISSSDTTYSIAANGYGSLTISNGDLEDVNLWGIYMTDPNLNLNDPNNTSTGKGGALITDLSIATMGTGVLTPQTDTASASFAGNYGFGAQAFDGNNSDQEFDFVGQGAVASHALNGTGYVSDPFADFNAATKVFSGSTFTGTATPDGSNPGRYLISVSPLVITPARPGVASYDVAVYQASGTQLFWLDENDTDVFMGPIEQQGAVVTPLQAAEIAKPQPKPAPKK